MSKLKNLKKNIKKEDKSTKDDVKKVAGEEEETEKESGTLSDGVLDAFDEVTPVVDPLLADPLLLEDEAILQEDEDDEGGIDSGDFKPLDDW